MMLIMYMQDKSAFGSVKMFYVFTQVIARNGVHLGDTSHHSMQPTILRNLPGYKRFIYFVFVYHFSKLPVCGQLLGLRRNQEKKMRRLSIRICRRAQG